MIQGLRCSAIFPLTLLGALSHAQTAAPATPQVIAGGPQVLNIQGGKIRVVPLALGLYHPWSLAFPDARTILVAERNGKLRMIHDGVLLPDPVWTSPTA